MKTEGAGGADTPATQKGREPRPRGTTTAVRGEAATWGPWAPGWGCQASKDESQRRWPVARGRRERVGGAVDTRRARDVPMAAEPLPLGEVGGGASAGSVPRGGTPTLWASVPPSIQPELGLDNFLKDSSLF